MQNQDPRSYGSASPAWWTTSSSSSGISFSMHCCCWCCWLAALQPTAQLSAKVASIRNLTIARRFSTPKTAARELSEDRTSDIRTVSYIQETHTTERRRGITNTPEKFRNFENDRIRLEASNEEIYYKMFGEREEEVTDALSPQS